MVDFEQNPEARDADAGGDEGEDEAVLGNVRRIRHDHGKNEGAHPGGYRVELRLDVGVSVALDDPGRKV